MELDSKPIDPSVIAVILENNGVMFWHKKRKKEIDYSLENLLNGGLYHEERNIFFVSLDMPNLLTVSEMNKIMVNIVNKLPQMSRSLAEIFCSDDVLIFGWAMVTQISLKQKEVNRKIQLITRNASILSGEKLRLGNIVNMYFYPNSALASDAYLKGENRLGIDVIKLADYGLQLDLQGASPSIIPSVQEKGLRLIKG